MPSRSIAFWCFICWLTTTGIGSAATGPDDRAASLRRLSQAFSDASAAGDAVKLARLLDDNVIFINENGDVATKHDLVAGAAPPPAGVRNELVQSHWNVRFHNNVAVTSFTDTSTLHFHGQVLVSEFLSTEVWLDERGTWRMISSQTLAVQRDPPAIELAPNQLDEYVGTYAAGPGYAIAISHGAGGLVASANGGPGLPLLAEVKDVFFVAGQPRVRRIFQRNAQGTIVGFVSRREGRDITFKRVG
jgi:hypothetical protein